MPTKIAPSGSKYQFLPSQLAAVAAMKDLGFTHAKIELEAQLGREDSDYSSCDYCDEGTQNCSNCDGSGLVECSLDNGDVVDDECEDCSGDGYLTCTTCDGDWEASSSSGDFSSERHCESFLLEHVSEAARKALVYSQFYNDGSVDSEYTFTVKMEDLVYAVEFLDAFNDLANAIGGELDTDGAGMHLSVLTEGTYPCRTRLDREKLANFTTEVTKLLPALYFVASPDHKSRGLYYRPPRIAPDKYSAISTHGGTSLEYRIFETCYGRPEALLEDYEVIANTLKYFSTRKLKLERPKFRLADADVSRPGGNVLTRFFDTEEKLRYLNAGLSFIKPKNKTVASLKSERSFKMNLAVLKRKALVEDKQLREDYAEYLVALEAQNENYVDRYLNRLENLHGSFKSQNGSDYMDYIAKGIKNRTDGYEYNTEAYEVMAHVSLGDREAMKKFMQTNKYAYHKFQEPVPFETWTEDHRYSRTNSYAIGA